MCHHFHQGGHVDAWQDHLGLPSFYQHNFITSILAVSPLSSLGTLSTKKNDIFWEFFPNVGPPSPFLAKIMENFEKY